MTGHDLYSEILDTYQRIKSQLKRDSIDPETEYEVREGMSELATHIARLSDDEAFLAHGGEILDREAARYHSGERQTKLCGCGDRLCPVKKGDLPSPVIGATSPFSNEDPVQALKTWMRGHKKAFKNVEETEDWPPRIMLEEWAEKHADAFDLASELLATARQ